MNKAKKFFVNSVILAGTSFIVQGMDVYFRVFLMSKVGAEVLGFFQLILSVYSFMLTFAISGINLATTRLVAEELGKGNVYGAKKAVRNCTIYAICFSGIAAVFMFFGAGLIGQYWLRDVRTITSIKLLAFALPCIAITSVWGGYFSAVRRVSKTASWQFFEQFIKLGIVMLIFLKYTPSGIESCCLAIVIGSVCAELLTFIYSLILFKLDIKKMKITDTSQKSENIGRRMTGIALPVAISTYIRSGLVSLEHMLIPLSLKKHGASIGVALSVYGIIHGVVLPMLLFPSAIIYAFSGLLVSEIAELRAMDGDTTSKNTKNSVTNRNINYIITRMLQVTLLFGIGALGIFFTFANDLAQILGYADGAENYIKMLAPLVPIMYFDHMVDGILKGLNEQVAVMRYNIIDSGICVVLVIILLPSMGIKGYILVLYLSEIFNTILSTTRLIKITNFNLSISDYLVKPLICIASSCFIIKTINMLLFTQSIPNLCFVILFSGGAYLCLLRLFGSLKKDDILWAKSQLKVGNKV